MPQDLNKIGLYWYLWLTIERLPILNGGLLNVRICCHIESFVSRLARKWLTEYTETFSIFVDFKRNIDSQNTTLALFETPVMTQIQTQARARME